MPIPVDCRRLAAFDPSFLLMTTPRLMLRPMLAADIDSILEAIPEGTDAPPPSRSDLEAMAQTFTEEWQQHGFGYLMAFERESQFLAGNVRLKPLPLSGNRRGVELTYGIDEAFRNKGYATECAAAALLLAFDIAGVDNALACVEPENAASHKVVQKLGFISVAEGRVHGILMRRYLMNRLAWSGKPAAEMVILDPGNAA